MSLRVGYLLYSLEIKGALVMLKKMVMLGLILQGGALFAVESVKEGSL